METVELARILATCSVWRDDVFEGTGKIWDVNDDKVMWGIGRISHVAIPVERFLKEFTRVNKI